MPPGMPSVRRVVPGPAPDETNAPSESLQLTFDIADRETIHELLQHPAGPARDDFARTALRLGVLALRQARGQIDGDLVRRESDRLLELLETRLKDHSTSVHDRVTSVLKDYFDPQSGRFQERVERLVREDGELSSLLSQHLGQDDSELSRTLATHFGRDSELLKWLNPDQSQGLLAALRQAVEEQLHRQRDQVLQQFSLDHKDSALSRFLGELTGRQGELTEQLQGRIDEVVAEFSLDEEDSALSRLVANVDRAQRTITSEFSLDSERSALSRLKRLLEQTNSSIAAHLSLDTEDSALARLKRELLALHDAQREQAIKFQEEVKLALQAMSVRKQTEARSTQHGLDFEAAGVECLLAEAQRLGDVAEACGNTTGLVPRSKVGDCVITLGPDTAAAGGKIVVEFKEVTGYTLAQSRAEIEEARTNRAAQVGLFVFSSKTAPAGLEPLTRYGNDVVIIWDADSEQNELMLRAGLAVCRALCVRQQQQSTQSTADLAAISKAIAEIELRVEKLGEIETWTQTILNSGEKIKKEVERSRKVIEAQIEVLREKSQTLMAGE